MKTIIPIALCTLLLLSCSTSSLTTRVDELLKPYAQSNAPGAAIIAIKNGEVVLKKAFGEADIESHTPNTPATNFRLASVTKQFTAMSILILHERGALSLSDSLRKFFPDFAPVGDRITIRHLLTHTSGLVDYEDLMPETTTVPILDKGVRMLLQGKDSLYFAPGTKFSYSNSGFAMLAQIVEKVSGRSFAQFLKENIFDVAGMTNTVAFENGISAVTERAYGHSPDSLAGFRKTDQSTTSSVLGDGGVYSSVEDLAKWDAALYTEKLVSKATIAEAFTAHIASEDGKQKYGYGWFIGNVRGLPALYHSGTTVGFRNFILRLPEQKITVIVLMNRADGKPEVIARGIAEALVESK